VSLVVLDTDAASALLRRRDIARLTTLLAGHIAAVTFVTDGIETRPCSGNIRPDEPSITHSHLVVLPHWRR
jgi:hypothetical protein